MASLEAKKFITVIHAYWFVLTPLCSTHHITLQSRSGTYRALSSEYNILYSAKLIGCYSTNGIIEVKTFHFKNCFDSHLQYGTRHKKHARQQWSSTATHKYFLPQVCTLTSFLTLEQEVSSSSGPAGCSGWEWHTCSAECYENNAPTGQQMEQPLSAILLHRKWV